MSKGLDSAFDSFEALRHIGDQLYSMSNTFDTIGMTDPAERLESMANAVSMHAKTLSDEYCRVIHELVAQAEEASRNMLAAALAGSMISEN